MDVIQAHLIPERLATLGRDVLNVLALAGVLRRGDAHQSLEVAGEVALVGEPGRESDVGDGPTSSQEILRVQQANLN